MDTNQLYGRRLNDEFAPRILSDEEIEMYLKGDRREVDRLILFSLNRLAASIIPLARRETEREAEMENLLKDLGGVEVMVRRGKFVDAAIKSTEAKTRMMEKVTASSVTWALIAFLGFVIVTTWETVLHTIRLKIGGG